MAAPNDSIAFSDTTNKNGIIQIIEFWTGLGDTGISGVATLLKIITARVNEAFDRIIPLMMSGSDHIGFDDTSNVGTPTKSINIVSGTSGYQALTDANSLSILNITDVQILGSATDTIYRTLERMTADDYYAPNAVSPNTTEVGVPMRFLELNNTIYLYPQPNYSVTSGLKVFFERDPAYFISTDTTKKPGIPRPYHRLLPLYAAYDWLIVNKPENQILITRIEGEIAKTEKNLRAITKERNPSRTIITATSIRHR